MKRIILDSVCVEDNDTKIQEIEPVIKLWQNDSYLFFLKVFLTSDLKTILEDYSQLIVTGLDIFVMYLTL